VAKDEQFHVALQVAGPPTVIFTIQVVRAFPLQESWGLVI
jgi:hypothetical protein